MGFLAKSLQRYWNLLFLSNVAELTCADPEFERLLLIARGSDARFHIMTVHGVDLLYSTHGTGH